MFTPSSRIFLHIIVVINLLKVRCMTTNNQIYGAGVYIDPLSDWGWKTLFGSDRYKEHLISFINAVYPDLLIKDITYGNNEDPGDTKDSRSSRFDLTCKTERDEIVMVEVQKGEQEFFYERGLWTTSFKIRDQAPVGAWDYHIKGVYSIGILTFSPNKMEGYKWNDDNYIHSFSLREDQDYGRMTDRLRFTYISTDKFHKTVGELNNILEKWVYLLTNLKRLDNRPKELQDRIFERFFKAAEIAKMTPDEQQNYRASIMNENDWNNVVKFAEYKAELKGKEEGKAETAKNLLALGVDSATIAKATGLTEEQVLALKD